MLNPDYKDILSIFIKRKVEFLLVGAYALARYGLVRATGDFDLFVKASLNNSELIYNSLLDFGAPMATERKDFLNQEGVVFQLGVVPRRIDIITQIDGVSFEECMAQAEKIILDGLEVPVISLEHLILNKSSTGRYKDLFDLDWLKKFGKK